MSIKDVLKILVDNGMFYEAFLKAEVHIKQLEDLLQEIFEFRISSSFAVNVNEWAIIQNKIKALEDK